MNRFLGHLTASWQALLAVVAVGLLPWTAEAANMVFKNDTNQTIYVQGFTVVNGRGVYGPILTVPPGKVMVDINVPKGDRWIKITDSVPRVLFNEPRMFDGTNDVQFSVMPWVQPKGPPKVNLLKIN